MKTLKIEEKTVGLETVSSMEGQMDDLENVIYDGVLPRELVNDLADLEEDDMDAGGADTSEDGNGKASEETGKERVTTNTNIHMEINIDLANPSSDNGSEPRIGIVKDSSVTEE